MKKKPSRQQPKNITHTKRLEGIELHRSFKICHDERAAKHGGGYWLKLLWQLAWVITQNPLEQSIIASENDEEEEWVEQKLTATRMGWVGMWTENFKV